MAKFVTNLKATLTSPTQVTLTWDPPTTPFSGYDIEIDGTIVEFDYQTNSYVHTIVAGSQHNYRLRTIVASGG